MRTSRLLLVALCLSLVAVCQQTVREIQSAGPGAAGPSDNRKELSAEDRKAAAGLLKNSEAEARGLSPELKAYALAQLARGYSRIDPSKAPLMLADAFRASTEMSSDDAFAKQQLQRDILF